MSDRDVESLVNELNQVYRRHLHGMGAPGPTIVVLIEDLADHVRENIQAEMGGITEAQSEACPGCGYMPGQGVNLSCNHSQGCGFWKGQE